MAPGTRARAERRILVLRQVRRADVDGVEVDRAVGPALERAQPVEAVVADVRDVERRRPWQRHLHAGLPLPRRRQLGVVLEVDQRRHADRAETAGPASAAGRCADPATSRSAGCPESRTRCCRPDGRRTARRRRAGSASGCRSGRRPRRSAAPPPASARRTTCRRCRRRPDGCRWSGCRCPARPCRSPPRVFAAPGAVRI